MNRKIKAIIFDFGGTLDTDGVHWAEKYWEAYKHFRVSVSKKDFRRAFIYAERKIPGIIEPEFSLINTYETQITYQLEYLIINKILSKTDMSLLNKLTEYCYQEVVRKISMSRLILDMLKVNYTLGLVSNYYGNIETVSSELGLASCFDTIVDSTIVGVRKPDKRIFKIIMNELNVNPSDVIVVGDSYNNDIIPAKSLGCKTIWLKVKVWSDNICTENADKIIKTIKELPMAIKKLEKNLEM